MNIQQLMQKLLPGSTATPVANLLIDGLAVCCFDRRVLDSRHWEVAFMRDEGHHFEIQVTERTLEGEVVASHSPYPVPPDFVTLDITLDNGSSDHYSRYGGGYYHTDAPFERDVDHDHNDFRWVVDFVGDEVGHGDFDGLRPKPCRNDQADMTLLGAPSSLFYTVRLSGSPVVILPRAHHDPCEGEVFGHTNEYVGGLTLADQPGRVRIKGRSCRGTMLIIEDLPHQAGRYYEIMLTNMDIVKRQAIFKNTGERAASPGDKMKVKDYKRGDFEYFYDLIAVTGEEQSLWGDKSVKHGRLGDCHVVRVNDTIQTLEPLLE